MKPDSDVLVYVLSLILYKMMMMNMMCCSCTMYDDDDDDVYLCQCMFCQLCGVLCKMMNLCFCSNAYSANELCQLATKPVSNKKNTDTSKHKCVWAIFYKGDASILKHVSNQFIRDASDLYWCLHFYLKEMRFT